MSLSKSEREALAFYATLPVPVVPSQTFAPDPIHYADHTGAEHEGRPDARCIQPLTRVHVESKCGKRLNDHRTKASSHWALQQEYGRRTHDGRPHPYNFYTAYFKHADPVFLQDNAWNNSIYKLLALQALHGWARFMVSFRRNPPKADAQWYYDCGLIWCTDATLNQMLGVIEFAAHGLYFPFRLDARRSGYMLGVNPAPNPDDTPEARRARYVALASTPADTTATF